MSPPFVHCDRCIPAARATCIFHGCYEKRLEALRRELLPAMRTVQREAARGVPEHK